MAYNLLDLRTRIRSKIKDSAYSATIIDGFVYDALCEIAGVYTWKWFTKLKKTDTLTVDVDTFSNPADHETTIGLVLVDPDDTSKFWDITKYRKKNDDFFDLYSNSSELNSSIPTYWTEMGNTVYFNCPADKAYKVYQRYQRLPTELAADDDVPDLPIIFREHIVLGASYRCEEERDNYDIAAVLQNRFNDRVGDMVLRFANDTLSGPDTIIYPRGGE